MESKLTKSVVLFKENSGPLNIDSKDEIIKIKRSKAIKVNNIKDLASNIGDWEQINYINENEKELAAKKKAKTVVRKNSSDIDSQHTKRFFTKKKITIFPARK